jgi:hypothetical protein
MWLFGLVMLGGFNLSLINFFTLVPGGEWKTWPLVAETIFGSHAASLVVLVLVVGAAFVVLNLIKILFIVVAHSFLHHTSGDAGSTPQIECDLCVKVKAQATNDEQLPYFSWLVKCITSSAITIALTVGITLAANSVLSASGYDTPAAVIINLLFVAAVTCIIGTWNVFTNYFIVLHGLSFQNASAAAIDLLVKHSKRVAEFVILLSVIYSFSVVVGNVFIQTWHFSMLAHALPLVRLALMAGLALWFAINNSFFNFAFLIFFDRTVKATPAAEKSAQAVAQV